jgi:BASS family bile acid:Na+ symporter
VQLFVTMLGMGVTLTIAQFRDIARRPTAVLWVLLLQFAAMPALALGFGKLSGVPDEIVLGLVLLTALPSGSLSNIYAYLGHGNVPLSITATCASTASCLVVTPLVLSAFVPGHLSGEFAMPVRQTVQDIVFLLLLPIAIGMSLGHVLDQQKVVVSRWLVRLALVLLVYVVVGALGSGKVDAFAYGPGVVATVIAFIVATLVLSDQLSKLPGFANDDRYTMAIEVCMRNGNLGYRLCASLFPAAGVFGMGARYVCLFSGGVMLVVCGLAIAKRRITRHLRARAIDDANSH